MYGISSLLRKIFSPHFSTKIKTVGRTCNRPLNIYNWKNSIKTFIYLYALNANILHGGEYLTLTNRFEFIYVLSVKRVPENWTPQTRLETYKAMAKHVSPTGTVRALGKESNIFFRTAGIGGLVFLGFPLIYHIYFFFSF